MSRFDQLIGSVGKKRTSEPLNSPDVENTLESVAPPVAHPNNKAKGKDPKLSAHYCLHS
jgi:hypothetical protein